MFSIPQNASFAIIIRNKKCKLGKGGGGGGGGGNQKHATDLSVQFWSASAATKQENTERIQSYL